MNKVRAKFKEPTCSNSEGVLNDDAVVKLYFKGDRHTAARLERAILKALSKEAND